MFCMNIWVCSESGNTCKNRYTNNKYQIQDIDQLCGGARRIGQVRGTQGETTDSVMFCLFKKKKKSKTNTAKLIQ